MEPVRVQIGAHLDSSWNQIFQPFEASAARARVRVAREMAQLRQSVAAAAKDAAAAEVTLAENVARAKVKAEQRAAAETQNAWTRQMAARRRDAEKEGAELRRITAASVSNVRSIYSRSVGVAGQIARGMGVNFDLSSSIQRGVSLRKSAVELSNSAYQPGTAGAAGVRQDPRALVADARGAANLAAMDAGAVMEGMQTFVKSTGDLETARAILNDVATLSRATGTEMNVAMGAAGEIAKTLGDTPNKAEKTLAVLKNIAAQGKLGAVEISDMAKYLGKVAGAAGQFGGDITANMGKLGALAQLARGGTASSAAEAATAAAGFVNTLKTGSRRKAFKAAGIDLEDERGQFRDPFAIIKESIVKKGNDPEGFKKLFANIQGAKAPEKLLSVYKGAGGGEKGIAAVDAEIQKLIKSTMGEQEIQDSFAKSMAETDAKAQLFQNRLDEIAAGLADRVLPAFMRMAPFVERAAEGMGKLVSWGAENPGAAIVAAIGASVTKEAVGAAIGKSLGGAGGLALSVAMLAVTAAMVQIATDKKAGAEDAKTDRGDVLTGSGDVMEKAGKGDKKALAELVRRHGKTQGLIDAGLMYENGQLGGAESVADSFGQVAKRLTGFGFGLDSGANRAWGAKKESYDNLGTLEATKRDQEHSFTNILGEEKGKNLAGLSSFLGSMPGAFGDMGSEALAKALERGDVKGADKIVSAINDLGNKIQAAGNGDLPGRVK